MTSGWSLLPSGSGLASLRIAPRGNLDRSRGLISPCSYPGFTPIFASVALTIRPTRVLPKQRAVGSIPIARSRYEIDRNRAPEIDESGALPFSGQRARCRAVKDLFREGGDNGCPTKETKGHLAQDEQGRHPAPQRHKGVPPVPRRPQPLAQDRPLVLRHPLRPQPLPQRQGAARSPDRSAPACVPVAPARPAPGRRPAAE